MKTKFAAIVAILAMIFGCLCTSTALAQAGKERAPKKEKQKKDEGKVDMGYGFSQNLVKVGPSITLEEAAAKLIKGKTTLDETLLLLGNPMQLNMYGEGGRMATYMWRSELRMNKPNLGKAFVQGGIGPFAAIGTGGRVEAAQRAAEEMRNSIKTLTAIFGSDGVLKDFVANPPIMPAKPATPDVPKAVPQANAEKTPEPDAPLIAATPSR